MTKIEPMQSAFRRAVGLGSAHAGVEEWLKERLTAVALAPLSLWFIASLLNVGNDYRKLVTWLGEPATTVLMILFLIALFHHIALGLTVVIEDYIHSAAKILVLALMRAVCLALATAGIFFLLRIALAERF